MNWLFEKLESRINGLITRMRKDTVMGEIKGLCFDEIEHAIDELKVNCQCPGYWKDLPSLPCPGCIVYDWYYSDRVHDGPDSASGRQNHE